METLRVALPAAACTEVEVRCGIGTCAREASRNIGGVRCVAPVSSSCSQAVSVRRNFNGVFARTNRKSQSIIVTLPSRRHARRAAAAEDETVDLLTLETEQEADQEASTEEESVAPEEDTGPRTIVKFVLQKECHFGQQFNVVGEIPKLGEWDPSKAVPMVWSEGHVWTADVPIPVGLTVKYKFVMTGKRLELEWQPGEDKVFETTDENEITVTGVWDDPIPVEDLPTVTSGEGEEVSGVESEDTVEAKSTNGLATASADSDLQEAVVPAEVTSDEDTAVKEIVESLNTIDVVSTDETELEEKTEQEEEAAEIPLVAATIVAEVSGEVKDATAAKDI